MGASMSRNIREAIETAKLVTAKLVNAAHWNNLNRAQRRTLVYGPGCKTRSFRKLCNRRLNRHDA